VAPRTGKILKNGPLLLKEGKFATKWYITYTLCLDSVNHQKSRCKGRIYKDEILTFLKRAWHQGYDKACSLYHIPVGT